MSRTTTLASTLLAVGLVSATMTPHPLVVWNASASLPVGFYRVLPVDRPVVGDLVIARPPDGLVAEFADRRYLPAGVPLLKRVAAVHGGTVCRLGARISIDGQIVATALPRDRHGRPLPVWQGCRTLGDQDFFLLITEQPASLDGRYVGPTPLSSIVGRAEPLWLMMEDCDVAVHCR